MASIGVNIDLSGLRFVKKLTNDEVKSKVLRIAAMSVLEPFTKRIHTDGLRADGTPIGTYSEKYMEGARAKNKRVGDKMIFVLTGTLELAWNVGDTEKGYGIVNLNDKRAALIKLYNSDPALLAKFGKVYSLSDSEKDKAVEIIKDLYLEELRKL